MQVVDSFAAEECGVGISPEGVGAVGEREEVGKKGGEEYAEGGGERASLQVPNQEAREEMQAAKEKHGGGGFRMHMCLRSPRSSGWSGDLKVKRSAAWICASHA